MLGHRIRLKGPWEYEWISGGPADDQAGKLQMPSSIDVTACGSGGDVQFIRRFHCPTNLDSSEQVFLVFAGMTGRTPRFAINDAPLTGTDASDPVPEMAANCRLEFEITDRLNEMNKLAVTLRIDGQVPQPAGLHDIVALEIRQRKD